MVDRACTRRVARRAAITTYFKSDQRCTSPRSIRSPIQSSSGRPYGPSPLQWEFPGGIALHSTFAHADGTKAVCLWQAASVDEVQDLVDSAVGQFSRNEYFEVSKETAMGLPD